MKPSAMVWLPAVLALTVNLLPDAVAAATHIVEVADPWYFIPANLTIVVGDTVEWRNPVGGNRHDVTANDGSFKSPTASSFTFSHTFNSPGIVRYHCSVPVNFDIHQGTIKVLASIAPADLALQTIEAPNGPYAWNELIPISVTLQNLGTGASGEFPVRFYASTDSTITEADYELGSNIQASLAAGQSRTITFDYFNDLYNGSSFIGAIIEIDDVNNANNSAADLTTVVIKRLQINQGLNDAWFDPAKPGQGFFITVYPEIQKVFLGWFTYEIERPGDDVTAQLGEPGHRWLTALGSYDHYGEEYPSDTASLDITLTQGGIFDSGTPAPTHEALEGWITLQFTNCNSGRLRYYIPLVDPDRWFDVPIQRTHASTDHTALCAALQTP
jgi:plastocyanin